MSQARNTHLPPVLAGIVNSLTPKVPAQKPPCQCAAYAFPHRHGSRCATTNDTGYDINDRADRAYDDAVADELAARRA
jgi:hypothetical protein